MPGNGPDEYLVADSGEDNTNPKNSELTVVECGRQLHERLDSGDPLVVARVLHVKFFRCNQTYIIQRPMNISEGVV